MQVGQWALCSSQEQEIADEVRQAHGLFQTGPKHIAVLIDGAGAGQCHFRFAADVVHRRAQVVRHIGGESGNPLEGLFQPIEHFVECVGKRR